MMHKLMVLACGALLLPVVNPAYSAPNAFPARLPSYSAPTVNDFLTVCRSDQSGCADEVGAALMNKIIFDGTANICLSSMDYAAAVPEWLSSHPETHNMPMEDGIYLTLKKLYPCG
jgi:hypothetical protein